MVYAKVAGSKQTVLAPSKTIVLTSTPQKSPSGQQKPKTLTVSAKTPQPTKQTMLKLTPKSQGSTVPKMVTSTPKTVTTVIKKQETKPKVVQKVQTQLKSPPPSKKFEPEALRLTVQKTLTEWLGARVKEVNDISLTEEEITELVHNIELELYKCYKDMNKYKNKYRSLLFNIKDQKNLTLFRKIADKSLSPYDLVRMTSEEMASQELAAWREKETKHQLEMIKKTELALLAQGKSIVVKTHKGEQIIEKNDGLAEKIAAVQELVSDQVIGSLIEDKKEEPVKAVEEKRKKDKERSRDRNRRDSKDRDRKEKRNRSTSKSHHHKSKDRAHSKTRDRSRDRSRDRKRSKDRKKDKGLYLIFVFVYVFIHKFMFVVIK